MLYPDVGSYAPNLKIHKDNFLVLDLAVLQKSAFRITCSKIGEQSSKSEEEVLSRFEDTLLSPDDLNLKLKAVILTYNCFERQFKPIDQQHEYPSQCTPYQYLKKKYESYLTIGLKINFQHPEEIQQLTQRNILKKIKLFSFDISEEDLEKQLPLMRKYVQKLFSISKKTTFHIKLALKTTEALKRVKQELILHQYPIEYCVLETNLVNLIERRFQLDIDHSWEEIAFKYTKTISKYIPSAVGCLLETYQLDQSQKDIGQLLLCFNHINHRNEREEKEYKRFHNTGMSLPQPLLLRLLQDFTPDEYGHFRAKGDYNLYLGKLNDVLLGKYKAQVKHQITEQGSYEQN